MNPPQALRQEDGLQEVAPAPREDTHGREAVRVRWGGGLRQAVAVQGRAAEAQEAGARRRALTEAQEARREPESCQYHAIETPALIKCFFVLYLLCFE